MGDHDGGDLNQKAKTMPIVLVSVLDRPVFLGLVLALFLTAPLVAGEPPRGTAQLASGRRVEYSILFDRNSLKESVRVGDGLIALATSGALLRFELPAVRLVRERTDLGEVACLGHGEGGAVLAGLADGRVCRVDPLTLDLADVVKLPAPPRWIGWAKAFGKRPAGLIVVTRPTKPFESHGERYYYSFSVVNDLVSGKTFALERDASAFLLDREGRFWLGVDRGEWGGQIHQVNLARGTIRELDPPPSREPGQKAFWSGVYGFIELRDGQIWAYGGTMHMGSDGYVTRIDGPKPQRLFEFEPGGDPDNDPPHGQPRMPFTHILEEKGALRVFSYNDVFQVDLALKNWKQVALFDLVYHGGRPDAMGSYPAIREIHPPARPGEPYILATIAEGYVLLDGNKATSRAVPGQLGADFIYRIVSTPEAIFFHEEEDPDLPIWKLDPKSWKVSSVLARVEPKPVVEDPLVGLKDLKEGDHSLYLSAWVPWTGGTILLASDVGLRVYDPMLKKLSKSDLEEPSKPVFALAKDGLGRLWLGGRRGLWMVEAGSKTGESLEGASWIGRSWVTALAPDPRYKDGVVAALRERGVVLVRALPKR